MTKQTNLIDFSAVIILCGFGLGSTLLVWFAGIPASGSLSGLWRNFDILNLFGTSFLCFLFAAALLRRMFNLSCAHRKSLLILLFVASMPTALFSVVLLGKAIHVYG